MAGIVHLGLGAFFRAHGALIVEDAVRAAGGDWGIIGVSLRAPAIRDQLVPQDCAYTAVEMSPTGRTPRVVNVLRDVVFAPEDPQALVDRMADPAIRIVSLTVTEFLLLQALAQRPGFVKSRDQLMDVAYDDQVYVDDRTIDSHIKRLRKKMRSVDNEFTAIETLYGIGYRYNED